MIEQGTVTSGYKITNRFHRKEFEPISRESEFHFMSAFRKGQKKALEKVTCSYMKLLYFWALKFHRSHRLWKHGVDVDELISMGVLSIYKCAPEFDPDKGNRFMSYFINRVYWDWQTFLSHDLHLIRIPISQFNPAKPIGDPAIYEARNCVSIDELISMGVGIQDKSSHSMPAAAAERRLVRRLIARHLFARPSREVKIFLRVIGFVGNSSGCEYKVRKIYRIAPAKAYHIAETVLNHLYHKLGPIFDYGKDV